MLAERIGRINVRRDTLRGDGDRFGGRRDLADKRNPSEQCLV
jgi:hypothetical protein